MKKLFLIIASVLVLGFIGCDDISNMNNMKEFKKDGMNREDANIAKYKSDISTIRSSIITIRSQGLMAGNAAWPSLEGDDNSSLFEGVLDYPIQSASTGGTGWSLVNDSEYRLNIKGVGSTTFTYDNGVFDCLRTDEFCDIMRQ